MGKNNETQTNIGKEILSWVICLVAALAIGYLFVTFIGQRTYVDGHSMMDTLQDGDNVICDKISYRFKDPQRFDIVVIHPDESDSKLWIKRVIALPGETIRIDAQGNIYVNGMILMESYGREVIQNPGLAAEEITLGEDEYWCMGDNRNNSKDSRMIGPVPRSRIVGKAFFRIYPFNQIGAIK